MRKSESMNLSVKFGMLIDLLYGLALATGLEHTIPQIVSPKPCESPVFPALVVLAVVMGLSDWVIYHLIVVGHRYRGILRLVLDIGFPILIFVLFSYSHEPYGFLFWFVVYSTLTVVYSLLLIWEGIKFPNRIGIPMLAYMLIGIAAICSLLLGWSPPRLIDSSGTDWILPSVVSLIWGCCSFSFVRKELRREYEEAQ